MAIKKSKKVVSKKTNENAKKDVELKNTKQNSSNDSINKGVVGLKDILAPSAFDRTNPDYCILDKKYVRSFVLRGYPQVAEVGWLDSLYHYNGDMDLAIHINIANERSAIDSITKKITQFESQLKIEEDKGSSKHSTFYRNKIKDLVDERAKIELNIEKLFHAQIACNLYSSSKAELEKETQTLDNKLRGRSMYLMPLYMRMDDGYRSVSPYGKTYLEDEFRNLNTSALTSCFPFYNPEISHENGIYLGINLYTRTPILVNLFDRKLLFNSNITILGQAGSGKTFFSSLLIMRAAQKGIKTCILDPEAEYGKLTKAFNGTHLVISSESKTFINIFDIEEEDVLDDNDRPTGKKTVNIKEKASEILNLVALMNNGLKTSLISKVADILQNVYYDAGFTTEPSSLYIQEPYFDEATGVFYHSGMKKKMPRFTDFHNKLVEIARKNDDRELLELSEALKIYKQGGLFDLFDCYTSKEVENYKDSLIITFDISKLEDSLLRKIGMYVALSWTWSQFVKKNIDVKKLVMCDEAWMLTSDTLNASNDDTGKSGGYYSATFLENASRRIRKRNAGLICASQRLSEFAESPQGRAVLTNSFVNIYLKQSSSDIDELQKLFKLSDGERNFLLKANKGEMIIKIDGESSAAYVLAFDFEKKLIEKNRKV
ncbi:DUF87 domain-containing protein [Clostridium sp.]|uniref:VirB4 family type IV secretion system protein n=1 Tax=Clostridium sp. TaxID=1506 RepID=UPI001B5E7EC3|nr:DUF87 domain-containing protein [Clostridium sp.]MBP3915707.1 DUF87 domain-containing protein [Clostridium sp.]